MCLRFLLGEPVVGVHRGDGGVVDVLGRVHVPRDDAPAKGVVVDDTLVRRQRRRLGERRRLGRLGRVVESLASGLADVRPRERVRGIARRELAIDGRVDDGAVVDAGLRRALAHAGLGSAGDAASLVGGARGV